ncbi:hypothetical protein NDU88_001660, partial [Pleurodeles waltl]
KETSVIIDKPTGIEQVALVQGMPYRRQNKALVFATSHALDTRWCLMPCLVPVCGHLLRCHVPAKYKGLHVARSVRIDFIMPVE